MKKLLAVLCFVPVGVVVLVFIGVPLAIVVKLIHLLLTNPLSILECFSTTAKQFNRKEFKMKNTTQVSLFPDDQKTTKSTTKRYVVQRYRLTYIKERPFDKVTIRHRKDVEDFCKKYLSFLPVENMCIVALDSGNNIIGYEALEGATNQCAVYPANVFRFLLDSGASSFIIAHNHPGGSNCASEEDWNITERLKKAGDLLEIPLLDHLIVTENDCVSLRESRRWR